MTRRGRAFTVQWRDETGRAHPRTFAWGKLNPISGEPGTEEQARAAAEDFPFVGVAQ
jgi:hypothetical protein